MPVCPHCGHDTPDPDARFCAACGRSLTPDAADSGESAVEATSVLHLGAESGEPAESADAGEPAEASDAAVIERLKSGTALLVVRRGPASGARFLLDADVTTAGRHPDSDIFLDDITVSRHHAEFTRVGHDFRLRDLGSLNGTYVNRSRIDEATLVSGDEVQIGKYRLLFLARGQQGGDQLGGDA
jgi:pSer/pThr/pTyr-binding forkhead associated (FHA) protein